MENEKTNILCSCCGKEIHTEPLADREEYLAVSYTHLTLPTTPYV